MTSRMSITLQAKHTVWRRADQDEWQEKRKAEKTTCIMCGSASRSRSPTHRSSQHDRSLAARTRPSAAPPLPTIAALCRAGAPCRAAPCRWSGLRQANSSTYLVLEMRIGRLLSRISAVNRRARFLPVEACVSRPLSCRGHKGSSNRPKRNEPANILSRNI